MGVPTEADLMSLKKWADEHMGELTADILMRTRGLSPDNGASITESDRKTLQQWADEHMDQELADIFMRVRGLAYVPVRAEPPAEPS